MGTGTTQTNSFGYVALVDQDGAVYGSGGASGSGALSVAEEPASTGTVTSVASAATSTTLLAANAARKGATIYNTDANAVKILLAAGTASATNFSVSIAANGYYEVPFGYTGIITGIWDVDGAGAALITQFTA